MARDRITPQILGRSAVKAVAGVAIDAAKGMVVKYEEQDQLLLIIVNSADAAKNITIKKSTSPQAFKACLGDEVIAVGAGETFYYQGMEQTRFKNLTNGDDAYGDILLDFEEGFTGTVAALTTL